MNRKFSPLLLLPLLIVLTSAQCQNKSTEAPANTATPSAAPVTPPSREELAQYSKATFAAGCFWCLEAIFESVKGVPEAISGYAGGTTDNPTYELVGTGRTGHAEAVEVYYDSTVIDYPTLLRVFFAGQDPTQVNGQGPDHGSQYRSIAFYRNDREKQAIEQYIAELNGSGKYDKPIATEVSPYTRFYEAEGYHQNYVRQHPSERYVVFESIPRLKRAQKQFPELLK